MRQTQCSTCQGPLSREQVFKRGRYCSLDCYQKARRTVAERDCAYCGKTFRPLNNKNPGVYCSYTCRNSAKTGEQASNWRGGRRVNTYGYIIVALPNKGWMYEHRLVMQRHLGRKLRRHEHVHHRNRNKQDNRIENLQVITSSDHVRLHAKNGDLRKH